MLCPGRGAGAVPILFSLNTWVLALILAAVIFGATFAGLWIGRSLRDRGDTLREPLAVLQGSLLAVVGLILAFGLTLAVGRYEARKAAVVDMRTPVGTTQPAGANPARTHPLQLAAAAQDLHRHRDSPVRRRSRQRRVRCRSDGRDPTCNASCGRWPGKPSTGTRRERHPPLR